jgi:predicted enzyme related to lactoylglutathione lyase
VDLAQTRIVTDDVAKLAAFYAGVVGVEIVPNDYYLEIPTTIASVAFSQQRFVEPLHRGALDARDRVILDFVVEDVDEHYQRIKQLGVAWLMQPTTQPWGNRSMMFRDPQGTVVNVYSRTKEQP